MFHSFSFGELALVFGIIIILFGGSRLASIGKSLGEGIANFKKGLSTPTEEEKANPSQQGTPEPKLQIVHNAQIGQSQNLAERSSHVVDVVPKDTDANKG